MEILAHVNWCAYVAWILAIIMGALHEVYSADTIFIFSAHPQIQRANRFMLLFALIAAVGVRFEDKSQQLDFVTDPFVALGIGIVLFLGALFAVRAVLWAWFGEWPKKGNSAPTEKANV